jgi:hypothetical protein
MADMPQIFAGTVVGLPTVEDLDLNCSSDSCKSTFREYLDRVRSRLMQAGCRWNQPAHIYDFESLKSLKVTHILHCGCGGTYRALLAQAVELNESRSEYLSQIAHVNALWVFSCLSIKRLLPTGRAVRGKRGHSPGIEAVNLVDGRQVTGSAGVNVSCSGFKGYVRYLVEILCHSLGLNFQHNMHLATSEAGPKTDVLVVVDTSEQASKASEKLRKARESNIPVVNFLWLVESYLQWNLMALDLHRYSVANEKDVAEGIERIFCEDEPDEDEPDEDEPDEDEPEDGPGVSDEECSLTPDHLDPPLHQMGGLLAVEEDERVDDTSRANECGRDESGIGPSDECEINLNLDESEEKSPPGRAQSETKERQQRPARQASTPTEKRKMPDPKHISRANKKPERVAGGPRASKLDTHITLSGMHSGEQKEAIPLLRSLGIPYTIGTHSWNRKFTHVITPSMRRNQKVLCALASGCWVLHPDFLRDSASKSKPASEKKYELSRGNPDEKIGDNIARFWRERIKFSGTRAFEGLVVCIHASITSRDAPSKEDIRAILEAGGATTIPWSSSLGGVSMDLLVAKDSHTCQARADLDQRARSAGGEGQPRRRCKTSVFSSMEIVKWLVDPKSKLPMQGSEVLRARLCMRD